MQAKWMIYGANGYTGELAAREAVRRGLRPIIGGRSRDKILKLANELGLEYRIFDVAQAGRNLDGIAVVLNCAGPFSYTARELIEACLLTRTHYVDITGEIPVFEMCHGFDGQAKTAGVILCSGAGFDIVPTDCLAAILKERLPDATTINLAFSFGTRPSIGTALTSVEGMRIGGLIRKNHQLAAVPNGYRIRNIPFPNGSRWSVTIPWGDVYTAGISTGTPNGMVFSAAPLLIAVMMRLTNPMRRLFATNWMQRHLKKLVERTLSGGPDIVARETQVTEFWGEAINPAGRCISATMSSPNVYVLTVDTAVEIAQRCMTLGDKAGYYTPSMLLGANFITSRPGVKLTVSELS